MAELRRGPTLDVDDRPTSAPRRSNTPLIVIFVIAGLILLGTFVYAFMMTIPGSMPGMAH